MLGHFALQCRCGPDLIVRYRSRISGPLLDRIDLHVEVPALAAGDLEGASPGERSSGVRERVTRARNLALARQGAPNARLSGGEIEARARPDPESMRLLRDATSRMSLSARARHRVLKVARTVADLDASDCVRSSHLAEALRYRAVPPGAR